MINENTRNYFNALVAAPPWVHELLTAADEVGAWETGIVSDRKQRGTAVNVEIYGFSEAHRLAVVQVRECVFDPRRWNRVRKNYFLIGRNENGNVFAHAAESPARSRKALSRADGPVLWALCRVWDCDVEDLPFIVRNGDVAFVPAGRVPKGAEPVPADEKIVLAESHVLEGEGIFRLAGTYYVARKALLSHSKGQHPTARVARGIWRVVVGHRAGTWSFSLETRD